MTLNITIPIFSSFDVYGLFLNFALIFMMSSFCYLLKKDHQIPFWKGATLSFIAIIFLISGARILSISADEWQMFFQTGVFPHKYSLTVLGAILFGPIGIILGKRFLGIKKSILDSLAIPVLLTMAIQRFGCLFAGCCNGIPTHSEFGVSYTPFTTAYGYCLDHGILDSPDSITPALHPVPIYLALVCIISSVIVYKVKQRIKISGNLFLTAMLLFLTGRFIIEFWRAPLSYGISNSIYLGLKGVQWLIILSVLIIGTIVYLREEYSIPSVTKKEDTESFQFGFAALAFIGLLFFILQNYFTRPEHIIFIISGSISMFLLLLAYFKTFQFRKQAITGFASLLFIALFFPITAQISEKKSKDKITFYKEIGGGFASHTFAHYHDPCRVTYIPPTYGTDCDGNTVKTGGDYYVYQYYEKYKHLLYAGAISFTQYKVLPDKTRSYYKINVAGVLDTHNDPFDADGKKNALMGNIEIGGGFDQRAIGMSGKINIGRLRAMDINTGLEEKSFTAGEPSIKISLPSFRFRLGRQEYVYLDASSGPSTYALNTTTPYPYFIGLGSGLGKVNSSFIRAYLGVSPLTLLYGLNTKIYFKLNAIEFDGLYYVHNEAPGYYIGLSYSRIFGVKYID